MLSTGETVTLKVNEQARRDTEKNHSATHLLQKALKTVLGSHVEQKGSLVTPDRLRFDFCTFSGNDTGRNRSELRSTCKQRNSGGSSCSDRCYGLLRKPRRSGAMALFGEKYDQKVRVVSMGDFSRELCGGTHVKNTSSYHAFQDRF